MLIQELECLLRQLQELLHHFIGVNLDETLDNSLSLIAIIIAMVGLIDEINVLYTLDFFSRASPLGDQDYGPEALGSASRASVVAIINELVSLANSPTVRRSLDILADSGPPFLDSLFLVKTAETFSWGGREGPGLAAGLQRLFGSNYLEPNSALLGVGEFQSIFVGSILNLNSLPIYRRSNSILDDFSDLAAHSMVAAIRIVFEGEPFLGLLRGIAVSAAVILFFSAITFALRSFRGMVFHQVRGLPISDIRSGVPIDTNFRLVSGLIGEGGSDILLRLNLDRDSYFIRSLGDSLRGGANPSRSLLALKGGELILSLKNFGYSSASSRASTYSSLDRFRSCFKYGSRGSPYWWITYFRLIRAIISERGVLVALRFWFNTNSPSRIFFKKFL